jgi:hypothetical protein
MVMMGHPAAAATCRWAATWQQFEQFEQFEQLQPQRWQRCAATRDCAR